MHRREKEKEVANASRRGGKNPKKRHLPKI